MENLKWWSGSIESAQRKFTSTIHNSMHNSLQKPLIWWDQKRNKTSIKIIHSTERSRGHPGETWRSNDICHLYHPTRRTFLKYYTSNGETMLNKLLRPKKDELKFRVINLFSKQASTHACNLLESSTSELLVDTKPLLVVTAVCFTEPYVPRFYKSNKNCKQTYSKLVT